LISSLLDDTVENVDKELVSVVVHGEGAVAPDAVPRFEHQQLGARTAILRQAEAGTEDDAPAIGLHHAAAMRMAAEKHLPGDLGGVLLNQVRTVHDPLLIVAGRCVAGGDTGEIFRQDVEADGHLPEGLEIYGREVFVGVQQRAAAGGKAPAVRGILPVADEIILPVAADEITGKFRSAFVKQAERFLGIGEIGEIIAEEDHAVGAFADTPHVIKTGKRILQRHVIGMNIRNHGKAHAASLLSAQYTSF